MNRIIAILFAALISASCVAPQAARPSVNAQTNEELSMIEELRLEIGEMQDEICSLHKNLMIVGNTDEKYGAKLKEAWRMPPSGADLSKLPYSLPNLNLIKRQLEAKLKRYRGLLVIGNAGY